MDSNEQRLVSTAVTHGDRYMLFALKRVFETMDIKGSPAGG